MKEDVNQSKQLRVAIDAAELAADEIMSFFGNHFSADKKFVSGKSMGLVTEADLAAERTIIDCIKSNFPNDRFLSEESHAESDPSGSLWVIDPLDGTNNFAHGIPHFSVSIAYCEDGVTKCGVIANPASGEVCRAEQGRGAWLGNDRIYVNEQNSLEETIVVTGFYYDRGEIMKATLATMNDLFEQNVRGIRRFGSAALDLAYVGLGRFGAYFEYYLSPWDYAAGKLFVEEAGGKVTDCSGNNQGLNPSSMLATNGHLHSIMLETTKLHMNNFE